jgi:hypothetical protein
MDKFGTYVHSIEDEIGIQSMYLHMYIHTYVHTYVVAFRAKMLLVRLST